MRRMLLFVLLLFPVSAFAQNAGPLDSYVWDYRNTDLTTFNVLRFNVLIDGANPRNLVPSESVFTNPTIPPPPGFTTYGVLLGPISPGPHTISVRACNTPVGNDSGCGNSVSTNFTFVVIPPTPQSGRFDRQGQ